MIYTSNLNNETKNTRNVFIENSGYNIENSLYGSNLNGSSAKCTNNNKDYSTSQNDTSINNQGNKKYLKSKSNNNKSEDFENEEFTFTTDIPVNFLSDQKRENADETNSIKKNFHTENKQNLSNMYVKLNPKSMKKGNENFSLKTNSNNDNSMPHSPNFNEIIQKQNSQNKINKSSSKNDNLYKVNNILNTSSKKDFSFEKNCIKENINNTTKNNNINSVNKIDPYLIQSYERKNIGNNDNYDENDNNNESNYNNNENNDEYIENNTTNTNVETTTNNNNKINHNKLYKKIDKVSYCSNGLKNINKQNILISNNEYEFRNNACSDRTPHTKLGIKINVSSKHNNSVGKNQIQIKCNNDKNNENSFNDNKNINKSNVNEHSCNETNMNHINNISLNNIVCNIIADANNVSNNTGIHDKNNNVKYYNNFISLKSKNLTNENNNTNQNKFMPNTLNKNNLANENNNYCIANNSCTKNISNTFNKSYINNMQSNSSNNHNTNTASLNSTIGNNNTNNNGNKSILHIKSISANTNHLANILKEKEQSSTNINKKYSKDQFNSSDISDINKFTENKILEKSTHLKNILDVKDLNKNKPTSLNYNTNYSTNQEENKFLCSKNIESIEEMHYQITAVLQSFNKIIRIQEVASEKENIFQTVNKCNEKEID